MVDAFYNLFFLFRCGFFFFIFSICVFNYSHKDSERAYAQKRTSYSIERQLNFWIYAKFHLLLLNSLAVVAFYLFPVQRQWAGRFFIQRKFHLFQIKHFHQIWSADKWISIVCRVSTVDCTVGMWINNYKIVSFIFPHFIDFSQWFPNIRSI